MTRYGYARVSTAKQNTDGQAGDLVRDGVPSDHVVSEVISGGLGWRERPALRSLIRRLRSGDALTVVKIDRLGRNAVDVLSLIETLRKRGISVRILNLGIDTAGAGGRLFLLLLAGFAEFERNIIRERVVAGLEVAKANGVRLGRRPTLDDTQVARVRRMCSRGLSVREIADAMHVSRMTVWRAIH